MIFYKYLQETKSFSYFISLILIDKSQIIYFCYNSTSNAYIPLQFICGVISCKRHISVYLQFAVDSESNESAIGIKEPTIGGNIELLAKLSIRPCQ